VIRELRQGFRSLTKSPGFSAVAILMLALGIGASTAIFSVVEAVLLRSLPYPHPQQIMRIWETAPDGHRMPLADPNFDDFRTQNDTFASLAVYADWTSSLSGGSEPVRVDIADVSRGFFESLGVKPFLGREFAAEELRLHGTPAAMVSHGYWQRVLGGSSDLSRLHVRMGGNDYQVVGVMPQGFDFPHGAAAWIARERDEETASRTAHNWRALGRLRDGVTVAQAQANLDTIARRIKAQYGKDADLVGATVVPLSAAMVGNVRTALLTLLGAVGLLLLTACANVAGLLLARTSGRRKELAVRAALGAGRSRLLQQFLAESFLLSFGGGLLGILIAVWGVRALRAILPATVPRQEGIAVNAPVLLFAVAVAAIVAVSLGLFAAWRATRGDLQEALTSSARGSSGGGASQRLRRGLVVGEIAVTLLMLIGAGLLGRSFLRLLSASPGFRQDHLITMEFSPADPADEAAAVGQIHLLDEILTRLRAMPGAESVGLAGALPAARDDVNNGTFLILHGEKPPTNFDEWNRISANPDRSGNAFYFTAGEGYFRTMGIPLVRGRLFGPQDDRNSPHVALISESLARQRWPVEDPIGKVIDFGNMDGNLEPMTIVGIVGDVRARGLDAPPTPIIYTDYRQRGVKSSAPVILMRSPAPAAAIVPAARAIFQELAPDFPVRFSTFQAEMGGWRAGRRFLLLLVGTFALAALVLAAVGIYGVIAFSVARRTQEVGIRMALGAEQGDVVRLIVGEGARLAAAGVAIGIVASLGITRLLRTLLFGVSANDPVTFAVVAALLCAVALLASYVPARRAVRLDPKDALRYE